MSDSAAAAATTWPRVIKDAKHAREKVRVEVECDDALVIHMVATGENQEAGKSAVGGVSIAGATDIEAEVWIYLERDEARELIAAASEIVALLEDE